MSKTLRDQVLLVEDDLDLGTVISGYLEIKGFNVKHCLSAEDALDYCKTYRDQIGLAVVDVQLPGINGFEFASQLNKQFEDILYLFLTARNSKEDRLKGLEVGAVDYIHKPFEIEELVLRIKNMLAKVIKLNMPKEAILIGDIEYHQSKLSLKTPDQVELILTLRESEVLDVLYKRTNQVIPKTELLQEIWGNDDYFNGKSLEVIISRLRALLKSSQQVGIQSRYGVGYMLSVR